MGALTGKSTIVRAKKVNQDYAASLNGTSKGLKNNASNANKAQKEAEKYKRTLLGFDQINKMDDNSSSDTGSGGGADAGALGGIDNMFENAVANNNQIVDGIRAGVYEAMVNALESFSGGENGQNTEVKIYLEGDSKKLFKVIRTEGQDYQKSTGKPVFE